MLKLALSGIARLTPPEMDPHSESGPIDTPTVNGIDRPMLRTPPGMTIAESGMAKSSNSLASAGPMSTERVMAGSISMDTPLGSKPTVNSLGIPRVVSMCTETTNSP